MSQAEGHQLAAIGVGFCDAAGYYNCPYGDGAAYVLLMGDEFREDVTDPVRHVTTRFPMVLTVAPPGIDHGRALEGHARAYGLNVESKRSQLRFSDGREQAEASFDADGRLVGIELSS